MNTETKQTEETTQPQTSSGVDSSSVNLTEVMKEIPEADGGFLGSSASGRSETKKDVKSGDEPDSKTGDGSQSKQKPSADDAESSDEATEQKTSGETDEGKKVETLPKSVEKRLKRKNQELSERDQIIADLQAENEKLLKAKAGGDGNGEFSDNVDDGSGASEGEVASDPEPQFEQFDSYDEFDKSRNAWEERRAGRRAKLEQGKSRTAETKPDEPIPDADKVNSEYAAKIQAIVEVAKDSVLITAPIWNGFAADYKAGRIVMPDEVVNYLADEKQDIDERAMAIKYYFENPTSTRKLVSVKEGEQVQALKELIQPKQPTSAESKITKPTVTSGEIPNMTPLRGANTGLEHNGFNPEADHIVDLQQMIEGMGQKYFDDFGVV